MKDEQGTLLVTCGDTPLVTKDTFASLLDWHEKDGAAATILAAHGADPTVMGGLSVMKPVSGKKIVEQKDGTPEELAVDEVNAGIYCFDLSLLWQMLHNVNNNNACGEYI